jgi:DNA-directed RNA polymerase subunit beta'
MMSTTSLAAKATKKKNQAFINRIVNKKELEKLLLQVYADNGTAKAGLLANSLKNLGFKYATLAGVTISIDDLQVPEAKKAMMAEAEASIEASSKRYLRGEITEVERYTKVIDTWSDTNERLTQEIIEKMNRLNPIYMMAFSGARGNISQVRQLVGMRGLMADSQGQIIDSPIKSNFREGLSVTEYIISSYGARKGLVDTALKTADSGYLTRRLVDVAQDVIITEEDCSTQKGILLKAIGVGGNVVVSLEDRIISRTTAVDIYHPETGVLIIGAGQPIDIYAAKAIVEAGVEEVLVRSVLTCETNFGICRKCYGWSLTTNKLVDLGEAIGIMAAQSIGEPGTQLTMRTFHTGGVFSGFTKRETLKAKAAGTLVEAVPIRDFRTRHGDLVDVAVRDCEMKVKTASGEIDTYVLPFNAEVKVHAKGAKITEGQLLASYEPGAGRGDVSRLTEKAAKDINSDISGKVLFEDFEADEKRDRQGNISRTSNRGGTIWVLNGDVYSLPPNSELKVEDNQTMLQGDVLAETLLNTEYGGEVRIPADLVTETQKVHGETAEVIQSGKEITIVIASASPANAEFVQTKKELLWRVGEGDDEAETYVIKAPQGTTVEHGSVIAELLDDTCSVPTSGEIRYEGVEVDDQFIITKAGKVLFIPEEIHQVSKDISLKSPGIESGTFVKAGTEVVAGIHARIDGVVYFVEENDIIHEVSIRPGELHRVDAVSELKVDDGAIVDKGTVVAPGIKATERSMITIHYQLSEGEDFDMDEEEATPAEFAEVLIRPVYEFEVGPRDISLEFATTDETICIAPITQLQCPDGAKLRQVEGATLLRTSLVLQMGGHLSTLKGQTELVDLGNGEQELKLVVLENLTIRHDTGNETARERSTKTQLLVKHGDILEKHTPLIKTQVLARRSGSVVLPKSSSTKGKEVRRLLLVTPEHLESVELGDAALSKVNDFVRLGQPLSKATAKGQTAPVSGQVVAVEGNSVTIHRGRPYLISASTQLHSEPHGLVQQGDLIATLIFERQKTGDIVQGLPKVEELLEGRKPKDIAVLAPTDGVVNIQYEEDTPRLFISSAETGRAELSLPLGANVVVEDGQAVKAGQPLSDGSISPQDLLEICGIEAVSQFLVEEVQRVYRSQGVEIADKHLEVIVRQMTRKVQIDDSGDTFLLGGELVDVKLLNEANKEATAQEHTLAKAHPVLLGITKASLNTESFISAASFQETTRVLTEAAIERRTDILRGLKENVIIGRLIPAGTGFPEFKDQREDMLAQDAQVQKSNARKPSAILEEIESMFGSPDMDNLSDFLVDDHAITSLSGSVLAASDVEEDSELLSEAAVLDGNEED